MGIAGQGQSLFDESPPGAAATDRLLFALFPDSVTAERIAAQAQALKAAHQLRGAPLLTHRFHLTLVHIGDWHGLPPSTVADAISAATKVSAANFEAMFDRAASFSGRPGNMPLVLRSGRDSEALVAFQRALCVELIKAGVRYKGVGQFTPHVTLLYDGKTVPEQMIEPIRWTAGEFVLVHSLLGKTKHIPLGRWLLG